MTPTTESALNMIPWAVLAFGVMLFCVLAEPIGRAALRLSRDAWWLSRPWHIIIPLFGASVIVALMITLANAHDSWISSGTYRNPAGEWCCGANDCGVMSKDAVHAVVGGYSVRGSVIYGEAATGNKQDGPTRQEPVNETVPYSQALPSPDGAFWRCKRPDGSPRCFFAPQPTY